jgi:hypothetical protein
MRLARKRSNDPSVRRITVARALFYLNAADWLVIGGVFVAKMLLDTNRMTAALVAFFFLINILSLVVAARIIDDRKKWVYVTMLVIAGVNTLMVFTGFPDTLYILSLIINGFIFINIIPLKKYYFKES